jgi:hypothetical protein
MALATWITIRGAGHYARPEVMEWCDKNSVDFVFGLYATCTGREELSEDGFREAWLICGRRAGKSFVLALIAAYLAIFKDWRPYFEPGRGRDDQGNYGK